MNPTPPRIEASDEHPDELTLTGWSEGRLLEFEREAVERHLAGCRACRALVAAVEPPEQAAPATVPARRVIGWRPLLAAAAALTIAVLFLLREDGGARAPRLELALAGTREAAFTLARSAPRATGELFAGVRLESAAWVRLVAIDDAGDVHEVPLDPAGATTARFAGGADHLFGPYPLALEAGARVVDVVALASAERLEWTDVRASGWSGDLDAPALARLARALDASAAAARVR